MALCLGDRAYIWAMGWHSWVMGLTAVMTHLCTLPADRCRPGDEVQGWSGETVDQLPGLVACEYMAVWAAVAAPGTRCPPLRHRH